MACYHAVLGTTASLVWAGTIATLAFAILWCTSSRERAETFLQCERPLDPLRGLDLDYSIIVPVYNRPVDIAALIGRLGQQVPSWASLGKGEIIVVDDGSTDETVTVARNALASVRMPSCVIHQVNAGVGAARNAGFVHARGAIVASIDSDCLPDPGWLPSLLGTAKHGSFAYAAAHSDRRACYPIEVTPHGGHFAAVSFAVRRDIYLKIGGICKRFGHHLEDSDLYLKAKQHSIPTQYAAGATVWHPLRTRTLREVWRGGLLHEYDNLLELRHGRHARRFLRNSFMGGNIGPHYLLSLIILSLSASFILGLLIGSFAGDLPNVVQQWFTTVAALSAVYLAGVAGAATYLRVPLSLWPRYFAAVLSNVIGSVIGRLRGTRRFGRLLI